MLRQIDTTTVTIGSDAEVPLMLVTGEYFPASGIIKGSKAQPAPLGNLGKGFYIQQDNVNAEFNIPPAKRAGDFENYIVKALRALDKELPPTIRRGEASSMTYRAEFLDNPQCQEFGCDPDYNAWTGEENPRPRCDDPLFRTAGAHVHVGWAKPDHDQREALIKMLDYVLGVGYSQYDDPVRRKLYGRAGAYRPKEYGAEYRVLGNFWLAPGMPARIFDSVQFAIRLLNTRGLDALKGYEQEIQDVVNGKVSPSKKLMDSLYINGFY